MIWTAYNMTKPSKIRIKSYAIKINFIKQKTAKQYILERFCYGTPDAIRTHDLQSRSLTLYPAELQAHIWCDNCYIIAKDKEKIKAFQRNFFFLLSERSVLRKQEILVQICENRRLFPERLTYQAKKSKIYLILHKCFGI